MEPDVFKFGSSVLHRPEDLRRVVSLLYQRTRYGRPIVAVVSAFAGVTDDLIKEANLFGAGRNSIHSPRLISLGEERTAALLALACDEAGLDARVLGARQLDLRAEGPSYNASPVSINRRVLQEAMVAHGVIIVPGFVALGLDNQLVLLGRGGTDLSAVLVAEAAGARSVMLVKDVDGVYTEDPASVDTNSDAAPQRFAKMPPSTALSVAGPLVQPKAIAAAEAADLPIHVGGFGRFHDATIIAADETVMGEATEPCRLRVGLAGLGVVGGGVAERVLRSTSEFELVGALVKNSDRPRDRQINPSVITTDVDHLFASKPDVIVDVLSSGDAGRDLTDRAMAEGVHIVSANKQALAGQMRDLHETAKNKGLSLLYSAAVGGGAPMVETVQKARQNGEVARIEAVLNGTVNYILSAMGRGSSFEEALSQAQEAGFAEADPSADLSGADADAKVRILSFNAFGLEPAADSLEIDAFDPAKVKATIDDGQILRQVGLIERNQGGEVTARVTYEAIPDGTAFFDLSDEFNAVVVTMADGRTYSCRGRGAGSIPTSESILADLQTIRMQMDASL
ncbi:MAG: homoserine dehydrogenase [Pseudomonadota bacterium]